MSTEQLSFAARPSHKYRNDVSFDQMPDDTLVHFRDVSKLVGMSPSRLEKQMRDGLFPPVIWIGNNRMWSLGVIRAWIRKMAARQQKFVDEMDG